MLLAAKTATLKCDSDVMYAVQQQNAMALGDFLVFLTRIASVTKFRQKMAATKWTSSLLKMVGYNPDTGESCFLCCKFCIYFMAKWYFFLQLYAICFTGKFLGLWSN